MKYKLFKFKNNIYIQGSIFFSISSFLINIINYIFHFITGRIFGPNGYGEITTLFSYVSLISIPTSVISTILIQKISSTNNNKFIYVKSLQVLFWTLIKKYSIIFIILIFLIPLIPRITNLSPVIAYTLIPFIVIGFIATFYNSSLQGLKLFLIYSLLGILTGIIKLASVLPAAFKIFTVSDVIITQLIFSLFILILSAYIVNKKIKTINTVKKPTDVINKSLISIFTNRQFIITLISITGIAAISSFDIIFVKKYFSSYYSGIYNSWNLFAKMILYVIGPILPITFVYFSSNKKNNYQNRILILSLFCLTIIGLISYIGYTLFGKMFINILFGTKFNTIIPYMGLASLFGLFYSIINLFNNYFLAKNSYFALILPVFIPVYGLLLYIFSKTVINIMYLNIYFTFLIALLYFFAYLSQNLYYNNKDK